MAKQLELRYGTTSQLNSFKGGVGELTYDTQTKDVRIHDGVTDGGFPLAKKSEATRLATETMTGQAKIATTAIAQEGVNDTDIITAKKLDSVVIGCNQKLNNVTASRVANTYYLNTNNRAVEVVLSSTLGTPLAQFTVTIKDLLGAEVVIPYLTLNSSIGLSTAFSFILSKGESYKLNVVPNLVLERV